MRRELTCIACPKGCRLTVETDGKILTGLTGNQCPKGLEYGRQETENPLRTLTTTVAASGLGVWRVPVRTSAPIPKALISEGMRAVRALKITRPVRCGEIVAARFLGLETDLVATRDVE